MAGLTWLMLPILAGAVLGEILYQSGSRGPWYYNFHGKRIVLDKSFGRKNWANIRKVPRELVGERNVVAFLRLIRERESGQGANAYTVLCGGGQFVGFADHPRKALPTPCGKGAAGAYQIIITTWDAVKKEIGLPDFSPASQDLAALGLIAFRGALPDVIAGNLSAAIEKCRMEWTSLPGAAENTGYNMVQASAVFAKYGGIRGQ